MKYADLRLVNLLKSTVIIGAIVITLLISSVSSSSNVFAGGPRHDYDERYEDIQGAPQCWTDGFDDGVNDSYDTDRANECADIPGDQYNRAFDVAIDICFNDREDDDGGDCANAREDANS